ARKRSVLPPTATSSRPRAAAQTGKTPAAARSPIRRRSRSVGIGSGTPASIASIATSAKGRPSTPGAAHSAFIAPSLVVAILQELRFLDLKDPLPPSPQGGGTNWEGKIPGVTGKAGFSMKGDRR